MIKYYCDICNACVGTNEPENKIAKSIRVDVKYGDEPFQFKKAEVFLSSIDTYGQKGNHICRHCQAKALEYAAKKIIQGDEDR